MKSPDKLGIDIDDGIPHLLSAVAVIRTLGIGYEVYMTTSNEELSHFHVETDYPTSIIMRRFLGDDAERVEWALARRCWNGRPPDFLGNGNRKRIKLEIPI